MCSELSPEQRTSRVPRSWRGFWPWDTGLCHLKQNREARSDLQSTFAYRGGWNNESYHSVSPSHVLHLKCHLSPHTGKASLHPGHGGFDEHGPPCTLHLVCLSSIACPHLHGHLVSGESTHPAHNS